jgi:hypothetical protein
VDTWCTSEPAGLPLLAAWLWVVFDPGEPSQADRVMSSATRAVILPGTFIRISSHVQPISVIGL